MTTEEDVIGYAGNLRVLLDKAIEDLTNTDRKSLARALAAIDDVIALLNIGRDGLDAIMDAYDAELLKEPPKAQAAG